SGQLWKCTVGGTSGTTQPTWFSSPISLYTTQADGGVLWTYQGPGTPASLGQRAINTIQHLSDGMTIESVSVGTLKYITVAFRGLSPTEQPNMEAFLNWIAQGKRFTWQPDKARANALKLCLLNPKQ